MFGSRQLSKFRLRSLLGLLSVFAVSTFSTVTQANEAATNGAVYAGSCSSQGSWTQAALSQTRIIENVIISLREDPACKGIESVVQGISAAQSRLETSDTVREKARIRLETLPSEIASLRTLMLTEAPLRAKVSQLILNKTLEGVSLYGDHIGAAMG